MVSARTGERVGTTTGVTASPGIGCPARPGHEGRMAPARPDGRNGMEIADTAKRIPFAARAAGGQRGIRGCGCNLHAARNSGVDCSSRVGTQELPSKFRAGFVQAHGGDRSVASLPHRKTPSGILQAWRM
jgi:hypothetical protein